MVLAKLVLLLLVLASSSMDGINLGEAILEIVRLDGSRNIVFGFIPWPKNSKGWQTADTAGAAAANVFDGPDVGKEACSSTLKKGTSIEG